MKKTLAFILFGFISLNNFSQSAICLNPVPDLPDYVWTAAEIFKADVNNDGNEDLVIPAAKNTTIAPMFFGISVQLSMGNGSFSTATVYTIISSGNNFNGTLSDVEIRDFDNDGIKDIITICRHTNSYYYLKGLSGGNFSNAFSYSINFTPFDLAGGDFNNDGKEDLVISDTTSKTISIFVNAGSGNFNTPIVYTLNIVPKSVLVGDFNNDNFLDLLVASQNSSRFLKNGGSLNFVSSNGPTMLISEMIAGDFNSDNKLDVACTDIVGNKVTALLGNGNFFLTPSWNYSITDIGKSLAFEDLNNDGLKDLVISSSNINMSVFLGKNTNPLFAAPQTYSCYLSVENWIVDFVVMDINKDEKLDIVCTANQGLWPGTYLKLFLNCNTVGLNESVVSESGIELFPNPARESIEFSFLDNETFLDFKAYRIYNNEGSILKDQEFTPDNNSLKINVEELPNGIYLLQLKNVSNEIIRKRFVIAR